MYYDGEWSEISITFNIKTIKTLSSILVTGGDIAKIIQNPGPNKAHGHDMISIQMITLCANSVLPSLELIFKSYLESVVCLTQNGEKQM